MITLVWEEYVSNAQTELQKECLVHLADRHACLAVNKAAVKAHIIILRLSFYRTKKTSSL